MNQTLLIIYFFLVFCLSSFACQANELIEFEIPETWKFEHKQHGEVHSYIIQNKDVEISLLYFCTPPISIEKSETQEMVDEEINFYLLKANERLIEDSNIAKVEKQRIEGIEFTGHSIIMFHKDNFLLALFSITNGHTVLSGHFTGSYEKWEIAAIILKSIKYKG